MPSHARRLLSSAAVVVGTVVVVVALLVIPGRLARGGETGPGRPATPTQTPEIDAVGSRNWTAITCPGRGLGCPAPTVLNLGGARFQHRTSHVRSVEQRDPDTRTLTVTVSPAGGRRWVLIGAEGASSASELTIKLGTEAATIPPGNLTLISVPGKRKPVEVTVADYGRSGGREVLHVEEYDALD